MPHTVDSASVLLAGLELIERRPPCHAAELRRWDAALCNAISLVERDAPQALAAAYAAVAARRAAPPWWAFRPWQRLSLALRARLAVGDEEAQLLVLTLLAAGANAAPGTGSHWHAEWAAHHLAPALALHECAL